MSYFLKIKTIVILMFVSTLVFGSENKYVWDIDISTFPAHQQSFIEMLVKARRNSDFELGKSILHPDIIKDKVCLSMWKKWFSRKTIKSQYAVKIKKGRKPDTLSFSIRHQNKGEDNKRSFLKLKNVVNIDGKLYININCALYKR